MLLALISFSVYSFSRFMTAFDPLAVSCSTFNSSYSIWLLNQNITQKIINEKKAFRIILLSLFIYLLWYYLSYKRFYLFTTWRTKLILKLWKDYSRIKIANRDNLEISSTSPTTSISFITWIFSKKISSNLSSRSTPMYPFIYSGCFQIECFRNVNQKYR